MEKISRKRKMVFTAITTLTAGGFLFAVKFTGVLLHMLLGMVVVIAMLVHVARKSNRLKYIPVKWRVIDIILVIAAVLLLVTGMLIHPARDILYILILHKMSAVVMVIACVIHGIQHMKKK